MFVNLIGCHPLPLFFNVQIDVKITIEIPLEVYNKNFFLYVFEQEGKGRFKLVTSASQAVPSTLTQQHNNIYMCTRMCAHTILGLNAIKFVC